MCRIYYEGKWYEADEIRGKTVHYQKKISALQLEKEEILGLYLKRDVEMLCLMFALYDCGVAFLPLDLHAPKERNDNIVRTAGIHKVLANETCDVLASVLRVEMLEEREEIQIADGTVAYCIATSGTTGVPKIVQTGKEAFALWMCDFAQVLELEEGGSIVCMSDYTFDMFMIESLFAREYGMDIILAGDKDTKNAVRLSKLIRIQKPRYIQATPSRMKMIGLVDTSYHCLEETQQIWLGGERIGQELLARLQGTGKKIINIYGPTETTVCCMTSDVSNGKENIGKPLAHSQVRLLNCEETECKEGEEGELCVGGMCLFDGYRGEEELTKNSMIFFEGQWLYQTGDLAVREGDKFVYAGRKDGQVKLRGYRVELGEIEHCLGQITGITDICVVVSEKEELCVYYVSDGIVLEEEMIALAGKYLPDYMIPYRYLRVEEIPMTGHGKRDRMALRSCYFKRTNLLKKENLSEKDEVSRKVVDFLRKKLGREDMTEDTELDEAGVDSLMYVEILVEIEEMFGIEFADDKVSFAEMNSARQIADYIKETLPG